MTNCELEALTELLNLKTCEEHVNLMLCLDIDYCKNATCKNGASCMDGLHNYTCSCMAGFSGDHCETGIRLRYKKMALCFLLINLSSNK